MGKNEHKPGFEDKLKPKAPDDVIKPGDKKTRHRRTQSEIAAEKKVDLYTVAPEQLAMFVPVIKIPFDLWAETTKREEMRLNSEEAGRVATPIAQLLNYYLPKISPVGYIWISFAITSIGVMSVRLQLLAKLRKEKKDAEPKPEKPKGE